RTEAGRHSIGGRTRRWRPAGAPRSARCSSSATARPRRTSVTGHPDRGRRTRRAYTSIGSAPELASGLASVWEWATALASAWESGLAPAWESGLESGLGSAWRLGLVLVLVSVLGRPLVRGRESTPIPAATRAR